MVATHGVSLLHRLCVIIAALLARWRNGRSMVAGRRESEFITFPRRGMHKNAAPFSSKAILYTLLRDILRGGRPDPPRHRNFGRQGDWPFSHNGANFEPSYLGNGTRWTFRYKGPPIGSPGPPVEYCPHIVYTRSSRGRNHFRSNFKPLYLPNG